MGAARKERLRIHFREIIVLFLANSLLKSHGCRLQDCPGNFRINILIDMAGKPRKLNYDEESASIVDSVQFALRGGGGAEPPGHSAEHGGHSGGRPGLLELGLHR